MQTLFFFFSAKSKKLKTHKTYCGKYTPTRVTMPRVTDNILKFKNYEYQFRVPVVAYADFECILKPVSTCFPKRKKSFTVVNELHVPMSFCIYFIIDNDVPENIKNKLPSKPYLYRGKNAAQKFMSYLVEIVHLFGSLINNIIPLKMTKEDKTRFKSATQCEMCHCEFTMLNRPVRDHCHLTGKFKSVLCNSCNLRRQNQKFVPVFIHASSNYDSHFIIRQLGYDVRNIHVIPNTTEKYVTFKKKNKLQTIYKIY